MFTNNETYNMLSTKVKSIDQFKPCPKICERDKWNSISEEVKDMIIQDAEKCLGVKYQVIHATDMMSYKREGGREQLANLYNERRTNLERLLMAECIVNDGKYMDDIINAVWCICEESSWVPNFHYELFKKPELTDLPPHDYDLIDLVAGETGVLLAFTYFLLKNKFDEVNPVIARKLKYELKRRIVDIYLQNRSLWWMGYGNRMVNNWAPWCASNCLMTILLVEDDRELRRLGVFKTLEIMDKFLLGYSEDGGCDEGPAYWGRAGASLYDCLWIVKEATGLDFFDEPIIKNIGEFPAKVHINKKCYTNFADSNPYVYTPYPLLFDYGEAVNSSLMKSLSKEMLEECGLYNPAYEGVLRGFRFLFSIDNINNNNIEALDTSLDNVFEGIQVLTSRQYVKKDKGLFVAIKGGHNDESHNHNDLGNFVVYYNGSPCIIDVGSGTYVKDTFGPNRYSIWNMQGQYHNVPIIGEYQQMYGKQFDTRSFEYCIDDIDSEGLGVSCIYDFTEAYDKNAGIISYKRSMKFDKESSNIIVKDYFKLEHEQVIKQNIMLCNEPIIKDDYIELTSVDGDKLKLSYDVDADIIIEQKELRDTKLINTWGQIYRLQLITKQPIKDGYTEIKIEPIDA